MGYENPRDRLELFLKKIIDKSTAPAERRTRFEQFLAGILDGSLVPDDPRNRLELYLKGVAESGGYIPPSGTIDISENGVYNVETKQYANVQVPVPILESKSLTLGSASPVGTFTPSAGHAWNELTVALDSSVIKAENIKAGVTLLGILGSHSGGGSLRYDSRQIACNDNSEIVTLGWQPQHIIVSWSRVDPEYSPDDPQYDVYIINYHMDLTQTTDITGEGDMVTFTPTGYTYTGVGTGFNDFPYNYSKLTFTAMAVS